MSVEALETIKAQAARLSPQEKAQLSEFLAAPASAQVNPKSNVEPVGTDKDADRRRRQNEWLTANRMRYGGLYVALDGDRLLGTGKNYPEAFEHARRAGIK